MGAPPDPTGIGYNRHMSNHYGFMGKFLAQPGTRDDLVAVLLEAARMLEGSADCLLYVISTRDTEPDAVWSTEIWTSKAAHDAALAPEEVRRAIAGAMPLIASVAERTEVDVVGGKGVGEFGPR